MAVVLAGLAAALAVGSRPNLLRARIGPRPTPPRHRSWRPVLPGSHRLAGLAVVAGGVAGVLVGGVPVGVSAAAIVAIGTASRRWTSDARRARDRERVVCAACLALTAELRSGAHPLHALRIVATEWPDPFAAAMRQAEIGGDVAAALRAAAGPGRSALHAVAAGWQVSERTGAALADVLTAVGDSLRADAAARREADAQLATVRVTARLLAVLPVVSLVLLTGGNLEAVRFLVGTSAGVACLAIAVALVGAGLWWVDRLARSATKPSW